MMCDGEQLLSADAYSEQAWSTSANISSLPSGRKEHAHRSVVSLPRGLSPTIWWKAVPLVVFLMLKGLVWSSCLEELCWRAESTKKTIKCLPASPTLFNFLVWLQMQAAIIPTWKSHMKSTTKQFWVSQQESRQLNIFNLWVLFMLALISCSQKV